VPSRPRRSHRVPRPVGPGAGRVTRRLAGRVALGAGAGAALVAVSGFRPLTRRWPAALAASLLAALATEIPRPTTAAVLAIEAEAARQGAARTPAGRLGVALAAGAVLALRVLDARTRTTHRVLEHALRDVLGPGCKRTRRRPRPPLPWLGGLAAERWRVVRERNISYGSDPVNVLDVWRRPDLLPGAGAPVLLQVHGGAWSAGGKTARHTQPRSARWVSSGRASPSARTLQTVRAVEEFLDVVVRGLRRPARGAGRGQ